jgi:ribonuclease HII
MLEPYFLEGAVEAGCDEAGRGCLAGPVFAAAVILPPDFSHPLLNDSKKVSPANREKLRTVIIDTALAWAVAEVDNEEIDRINILKASFLAMHRALDQLKKRPSLLLIDGNRFIKYKRIAHRCIIGGDGKYASIAAASILAKTFRDEHMDRLHEQYPQYGWNHNRGYGTEEHRRAIAEHGITSWHRRSFQHSPIQRDLDI